MDKGKRGAPAPRGAQKHEKVCQSLSTQSSGSNQHQHLHLQSKLTQTVCQLQHFTASLTAVHGQIHCNKTTCFAFYH